MDLFRDSFREPANFASESDSSSEDDQPVRRPASKTPRKRIILPSDSESEDEKEMPNVSVMPGDFVDEEVEETDKEEQEDSEVEDNLEEEQTDFVAGFDNTLHFMSEKKFSSTVQDELHFNLEEDTDAINTHDSTTALNPRVSSCSLLQTTSNHAKDTFYERDTQINQTEHAKSSLDIASDSGKDAEWPNNSVDCSREDAKMSGAYQIKRESLPHTSCVDIIDSSGAQDSIQFVQNRHEQGEIVIIDSDDEGGYQSPIPKFKPNITTALKQPTLQELLAKNEQELSESPPKKQISRMEYVKMRDHLEQLNTESRKLQFALSTIQLSQLPDKGSALIRKKQDLQEAIEAQKAKFVNIEVKNEAPLVENWQAATDVQPRTFGKQAMETYNNEKALTLDRLHNLHASIKTCPTPDTLADDPSGIKVDLMVHQKHALAWLQWREQQKPAGGILADDMGLGKTLTMISLICACKAARRLKDEESERDSDAENDEESNNYRYRGGTLVVCPASLIGQWANEVSDKLKRGLLSVEIYHGPKRETKTKRLAKYDIVVTTYAICLSEGQSDTPLYRIKWDRIILDEAHQIRNHKSKTSMAVFRLGGRTRWALTGTPVHNKELDLFALLKFLRCSPFDDINIFKRWVSQKANNGHQRLHTVLSSLLLRRTKEQLKEMEQLTCLPEREWELLEVTMDEDEIKVYQKILLFSRTLFSQFLHQRAEKNTDNFIESQYTLQQINDPNKEYYKMHKKLLKMNKLPTVKQSDILVLLLRLRQICCHPSLITAMLDTVADLGDDVDDDDADVSLNLLNQLNNLNIDDADDDPNFGLAAAEEGMGFAEASRGLFNPSNPIFDKERQSAKLRAVMELLKNKIPLEDKVIIVSQWTSLLHLVVAHLKELGINFCQLDGTVQVHKRGDIVSNFNNVKSGVRVMLLSLTAGGVGLNLVGANHLVFLDLHWNPQLEMQAQDRIYRVGQRKKVFIYKFITVDTIEQRIKTLQDKKKEIAAAMLNGAKMTQSKLSLQDLKMLFNM